MDTPDTLNYLIFGMAVIFGLIGVFVVTLYTRHRNLDKDLDVLEQLRDEKN